MPAIRRLVARTFAVALVSTSTLLVPAAGQTSDGTSDGTVQQSPGLTLAPDTGPPGSQVTANGGGYANCSQASSTTVPQSSSTTVPDSPSSTEPEILRLHDETSPGAVALTWDGENLAIVELDRGAFSATFLVPETASPGTSHTVEARCVGAGAVVASTEFTVVLPVPVRAIVPNLAGLTIGGAQVALEEAGLELGGVSGDGDVIRSQGPLPGTEVPRGTAVDVTLGAPEPQLVTVPNLVGIEVDEAPRILQSIGLALGQTSGDGDVIRSQRPPAGARVPSGSAVDVSVGGAPGPEQLVAVPDLVNGTVDEARAALADVGLVLGDDPDGDSTVDSQAPAAGTLVPTGTTVTVTVGPPTVPISHPTPLWPVAVALILLGAAALLGPRAVRAGRGPRWVRRHVRIVAGAAPGSRAEVTSPADPSPPSVVRIEPHGGICKRVLEEVDR